jgi:polar amino acid transport system substrate-binding protein
MKKYHVLGLALLLSTAVHADSVSQNLILRVGISYYAPYVMQASNNQFYGFDISMMNDLCSFMQRQCKYVLMDSEDIFPALLNNRVDLAVGGIVMTPDRSSIVNFSMPYMLSQGQFMALSSNNNKSFNYQALARQRIGVVKGSAYEDQIKLLNIIQPQIITFKSVDLIISALQSKDIAFGFFDTHTAQYWSNNSSGKLQVLGTPFSVGFGMGVVTNPANQSLTEEVNIAIVHYQNSPNFKTNYDQYLDSF